METDKNRKRHSLTNVLSLPPISTVSSQTLNIPKQNQNLKPKPNLKTKAKIEDPNFKTET